MHSRKKTREGGSAKTKSLFRFKEEQKTLYVASCNPDLWRNCRLSFFTIKKKIIMLTGDADKDRVT